MKSCDSAFLACLKNFQEELLYYLPASANERFVLQKFLGPIISKPFDGFGLCLVWW